MDFEMEKNNVVWTSLETESKPGTIEFDVHEPQGLKGEVKRNWFLKNVLFAMKRKKIWRIYFGNAKKPKIFGIISRYGFSRARSSNQAVT